MAHRRKKKIIQIFVVIAQRSVEVLFQFLSKFPDILLTISFHTTFKNRYIAGTDG